MVEEGFQGGWVPGDGAGNVGDGDCVGGSGDVFDTALSFYWVVSFHQGSDGTKAFF